LREIKMECKCIQKHTRYKNHEKVCLVCVECGKEWPLKAKKKSYFKDSETKKDGEE
jgi:uncharacterized Zn ribbon protein